MRETIYTNVARLREEAQITQEELAYALRVTRQTIIAIEKGNYIPSVLLALKLGAYFKKPVEHIFSIRDAK